MKTRPDTPYHNSMCNLGQIFQSVVGGNFKHTPLWYADGTFKGDEYDSHHVSENIQPEQLEAHIASFLKKERFSLSPDQPKSRVILIYPDGRREIESEGSFTKSGCLRLYLHPSTPNQKYLVSLGISNKLKIAGLEVTLLPA